MRNMRKMLTLIAVVAVMVAALAVSAFAYIEFDPNLDVKGDGTVMGGFPVPLYMKDGGDKGRLRSAYSDINTAGWVQLGFSSGTTSDAVDANADGDYLDEGDIVRSPGARFYYNKATKTIVMEGDWTGAVPSAGSSDPNTKNHISNLLKNLDETEYPIETFEIRNCGGFNNNYYIWTNTMDTVKTVKIDTRCSSSGCTKNDTAPFINFKALETLVWGTWDKNKTEDAWVQTSVTDGIDMSGFKILNAKSTQYIDSAHLVMYNDYWFSGSSSIKKITVPVSLYIGDDQNWNVVAVADGTDTYLKDDLKTVWSAGTVVLKQTKGTDVSWTNSWQASSGWTFEFVVGNEQSPYFGDVTGIFGVGYALNCTSLDEVVIPADSYIQLIENNAFANCGSFKFTVNGYINDNIIIESGAFNNCTSVEFVVTGSKNEALLRAALDEAGYGDGSIVTVTNTVNLTNPITSRGTSFRMNEYTGFRAEFDYDEVTNDGWTIQKYGIAAVSAANFASLYDSNPISVITNFEQGKVKNVVVEAWDGTEARRRFVDIDKKIFCLSLTGIKPDNYDSDIYFVAYAEWKNADGLVEYTITEFDETVNVISLYDTTLGLYKRGQVNSQACDDICLWNVLETGAATLTVADGEIVVNKDNATYSDTTITSFTYKNLPLYSHYTYGYATKYTSAGASDGVHVFTGADESIDTYDKNGKAVTVKASAYKTTGDGYSYYPVGFEATSTTNIKWSLLVDSDGNYVAVYRRDNKDKTAKLPQLNKSNNYKDAYHPFDYRYGTGMAASSVTVPSPILTSESSNKVLTMIVDYGISGGSDWGIGNNAFSETIVYPEGFTYGNGRGMRGNTKVKDVIWCRYTKTKDAEDETKTIYTNIKHRSDITWPEGEDASLHAHLVDVRGFGNFIGNSFFHGNYALENVLIYDFYGWSNAVNEFHPTISSMKNFVRLWVDRTSGSSNISTKKILAPNAKTYDISGSTKLVNFKAGMFNIKESGWTIKFGSILTQAPSSGKAISDWGETTLLQKPASGSAPYTLTIIAEGNTTFEDLFADYYRTWQTSGHLDNVTVNGMTMAQLIAKYPAAS